ncbi:MAG: DUF861 domain-containing protein [Planctomycetes bacterium]|nr:DUF861 domain-containing protein [Planctomycetota bacterium]
MAQSDRIPVSHVATQNFEPYLSAGQPFGEVHWLRIGAAGEGVLYTGLWKHGCATFDYVFPGDETFQVLEGAVSITVGDQTVHLGPGDLVSFAKGQASTWAITSPLKKFFVISG